MKRSLLVLFVAVAAIAVAWWLAPEPEPGPPAGADPERRPTTVSRPLLPDDAETATQSPVAAPEAPPTREAASIAAVRGRLLQAGEVVADVVLRMVTGQPERELARTCTAKDGSFVLPTLDGQFRLTADAPVLPRGWYSPWMGCKSQDTALGDVHVPRCAVVSGVVRDEQGQAVAGARVVGPFSAASETDEQGQYRLDRVLPGDCALQVRAAGLATASVTTTVDEGAAKTFDVVLPSGLRVEGLVLDWRGGGLPGARVSCNFDGCEVTTDAAGRFLLEHHASGQTLHFEAPGHVPFDSTWIHDRREVARVQLTRAVTLRGIVHGAENVATTLRLETASDPAPDAARPGPYSLLYEPLPIAADGTFAIVGLSLSDYLLSARTAAGGVCPPVRVALRDDTSVELTIVTGHELEVRVRGEHGAEVLGAELIASEQVREYPSLFQPGADDVIGRILGYGARPALALVEGKVRLHVGNEDAVAFVVRAPGFLPVATFFAAGQVPQETEVVLPRAGSVRGVVHGGHGPAYVRWVSFWPRSLGNAPPDQVAHDWSKRVARNLVVGRIDIDAEGRFFAANVAPGSYRASVARYGRAHVGNRPDEQVGALPLVDNEEDLRGVVDLEVTAGNETRLELTEPALGTLRGTVRRRGVPCAGVTVVAARPGAKQNRRLLEVDPDDWDDDLVRGLAPGQRTAAAGTFTFLYRDAGPLELRVRHADGAATSAPFVVTLPPPGDEVLCDLEVPLGAIRGRVPIEGLAGADEQTLEIVLFPLRKVADDPFWFGEWSMSLASNCSKSVRPANGRFTFDYLPDGDWLVRVACGGWKSTLLGQLFVHVQGDVVDLGDLALSERVTATLRWSWSTSDQPPGTVCGVWLQQPLGGGATMAWAGTFGAKGSEATCSPVVPGRYSAVPFGYRGDGGWMVGGGLGGITGVPLGKPQPIEIHADGSITPPVVTFVEEPAPK